VWLLWGSVCHHVEREASRFHHIYPPSQTVIMLLYDTAFKYFRMGDASVIGRVVRLAPRGDAAAVALSPPADRVLGVTPAPRPSRWKGEGVAAP
jgi:hypothetical protein